MAYNPYRKYCLSWWKFWLNLPSDILAFLRRLRDYAPLLWDDRDWDYAFLLRMMRFKIRRMRAYMGRPESFIAHAEDHFAEMAQADVLLRNVVDEDPDDEWSEHFAVWHAHLKDRIGHCSAPGASCRLALLATAHRDKRNWSALWSHLEKYLQGWWD